MVYMQKDASINPGNSGSPIRLRVSNTRLAIPMTHCQATLHLGFHLMFATVRHSPPQLATTGRRPSIALFRAGFLAASFLQ
jgi:S1-C subfamily serine protease